MLELSIVIPAYNEGPRIGPTLERIVDYLAQRGGTSEVLVVDDGSSDDTCLVAGRYPVRVLRQPRNAGKGAALRAGVLASSGRRVLLTDADLSTPIEEVERLEPFLLETALVVGSRDVAGARIGRHQPLPRELMGRTFNLILRALRLTKLRDTQCGFKLIDGAVGRELFAKLWTDRFAYDVELIWLAEQAGHRVREVGVAWNDAPGSRVHPLRDASRMLFDVLRFRLHHRTRR